MQEKIEKQLLYISKNSSFYQNKLKGLKRFVSFPFTTKTELLCDQEKYPPFGSNLCVSIRDIIRVHKTSGTTNRPLLVVLTKKDIKNTIEIGAKCFKLSGLKRKDIVVHCFNYNMWSGGYTDHQSLEEAKATVIPFGVGNSRVLIETIIQLGVTAIHCTPSYLSILERIIKDEFKIKPHDLKLRLGLFGGESGLQNQDFRRNIEETWGFKAMNANYGMSEVLSMFGAECLYQDGCHFMGEDKLYPELIDTENNLPLSIKDGVIGELVVTNLQRQAQPLIRYRTGDIIKVLGTSCRCGHFGFRFEVLGRRDDMLIVKGLNVFPNSIEQIINKYLSFVSDTYQVLISQNDPIDQIRLVLEIKKDRLAEKENLRKKIVDDFSAGLEMRPQIDFVDEGFLPRSDGKSKKILRVLGVGG